MNINDITYLAGSANINFDEIKCLKSFDEKIIKFFELLSKELINNKESKLYSDIITFAFYIRKANISKIKELYDRKKEGCYKFGRGIVFHIAPSNVPVNFAYSLFASLLCGNANIVKVSSKNFIQVNIICDAIKKILEKQTDLKPYITIVRYDNEKEITDYFSSICDVRVIWGGDKTIELIRESKLKPRAREITFADRYSLLILDSNYYNKLDNIKKEEIANSFYNDTFLTDQNACTSPRIIFFLGSKCLEFYTNSLKLIEKKYNLNDIACSDKLVEINKFSIKYNYLNPKFERIGNRNYIYTISVDKVDKYLIDFKGNQGLFVDCVINNINEIRDFCDDDRIQTISYVGEKEIFQSLLNTGIKGVDRIVPIGKTMDFDLIWDGYNLYEMLTKDVKIL